MIAAFWLVKPDLEYVFCDDVTPLPPRLVFRGQIQTVLHVACALLLVMCVVSLFYGKVSRMGMRLCECDHTHITVGTVLQQTELRTLKWEVTTLNVLPIQWSGVRLFVWLWSVSIWLLPAMAPCLAYSWMSISESRGIASSWAQLVDATVWREGCLFFT